VLRQKYLGCTAIYKDIFIYWAELYTKTGQNSTPCCHYLCTLDRAAQITTF